MKQLLSILLAILCVMNLTVVSFAAESEVSYFDEETGTLTIDNDEQWEEIIFDENIIIVDGQEWPEKYYEIYDKVEVVKLGKNVDKDRNDLDLFGFSYSFPNVREVIIDENNAVMCVYDGLVYSKDKKTLLYIPPKNTDAEIYLPEELANICFTMRDSIPIPMELFAFDDNHKFDIYITGGKEQIEQMGEGLLKYLSVAKADAVYVNATQDELDSIIFENNNGELNDIEFLYLNTLSSRYATYCYYDNVGDYVEFMSSLDYLMSDYPAYDGNGDENIYNLEKRKESLRRKLAYCVENGYFENFPACVILFDRFVEAYNANNKIKPVNGNDNDDANPNTQPPANNEPTDSERTIWDEIADFFDEFIKFFTEIFDWFKKIFGF